METQKVTTNHGTTKASVREQLRQEIDQAPDEILAIILEFLIFLKSRYSDSPSEASEKSDRTSDLPYRPASGKSLVNYQGGWAGDDFDECLQRVHDSRSKVNFSKHEPF